MNLFEDNLEPFEPGLGGVVSLEPQPFLHGVKRRRKVSGLR